MGGHRKRDILIMFLSTKTVLILAAAATIYYMNNPTKEIDIKEDKLTENVGKYAEDCQKLFSAYGPPPYNVNIDGRGAIILQLLADFCEKDAG